MALKMLSDPLITHEEVADALRVSRATLYRALERHKQEIDAKLWDKANKKRKLLPPPKT